MKRKHSRHLVVSPDPDTHVYVNRKGSAPSSDSTEMVIKVALGIAGLWFGLGLLAKLLPWLILGAVGWFILRIVADH